jgi:hypothetical protein
MKKHFGLIASAAFAIGIFASGTRAQGFAAPDDRIQVKVDASEADAVLSILAKKTGPPLAAKDWDRLFATEPYRRLKQREASLKRDFTDEDFKAFVRSPALAAKAGDLRPALEAWRGADIATSARRVLAFLPGSARIKAKIYIVIKPKINSFVFELSKDPAIFLYLDPQVTAAKFENTVAHELHHVGLASIEAQTAPILAGLPPHVRSAVEWMGSFGEGAAMLAAAGSTEIHPHAVSLPAERERWDGDMKNFDRDLKEVETFFLDVISGRLHGEEAIREKAFSFFGVQGPWYTVGYKMVVLVEKAHGRASLIECLIDPRLLLKRYNAAAILWNARNPDKLPLWSEKLLAVVFQASK